MPLADFIEALTPEKEKEIMQKLYPKIRLVSERVLKDVYYDNATYQLTSNVQLSCTYLLHLPLSLTFISLMVIHLAIYLTPYEGYLVPKPERAMGMQGTALPVVQKRQRKTRRH
jgi:hypothetical protein